MINLSLKTAFDFIFVFVGVKGFARLKGAL
jgi:hypothetical protein